MLPGEEGSVQLMLKAWEVKEGSCQCLVESSGQLHPTAFLLGKFVFTNL